MSELNHLSYSSVSTYQLCARSWRLRYIDKVPTLPSPSLVFGSAFHATVEHALHHQHQKMPIDLSEAWKEQWGAACQQPVAWDGDLPEQFEGDGLRMLAHPAAQELIARLSPLTEDGSPAIEKRVELRVPGVAIPVIGFIDLIADDGVPVDLKTANRAWSQDQAERETQPLFYLAALNQAGYKIDYRFRHVVFVKTQAPQVQTFESQHHPASLFWLYSAIQAVWRGIEHEVFVPNPTSWKCTPRFCDFWKVCRGKR